jgi:beta-amylase
LRAQAQCSPEGLLRQVRLTAAKYGVLMSGENALCRFDEAAHAAIVEKAFARDGDGQALPPFTAFTFLR